MAVGTDRRRTDGIRFSPCSWPATTWQRRAARAVLGGGGASLARAVCREPSQVWGPRGASGILPTRASTRHQPSRRPGDRGGAAPSRPVPSTSTPRRARRSGLDSPVGRGSTIPPMNEQPADPDLLAIGIFARLSGLSVGALRHYDELDLL